MNANLSLRVRLTLIILLPLLVISAAVAVWASRDAQIRSADRFDRSLLVTALGISRDTATTGGDALSPETRDLLRDTSGGPVFYHVYAPDGVFVIGYATPPVPPSRVSAEGYTYFDAIYQTRPVRAVRFSDRMDVGGLTGEFTFTVWQDLSLRDGFVQSLSRRTYAVMVTLVAAVALIVWFGVRVGLRPLLDLEQAIARRSAEDLNPIKRAIPQEVQGVVGRLNALLLEMSNTLRTKDNFISDAAHQLRNPIAGVLALSEAVAASKTEADFRERSADLTEAASHAAKLTEDLLAMERARLAPPPQSLPRVDLSSVLAEVTARLSPMAAKRDVSLVMSGVEKPVVLRADRVLFQQAIENLVENALEHGGPGLSEIAIDMIQSSCAIQIMVLDDGKGLATDMHDVALSRFGQASPGKGSGLGLSIARAIVEAHGGALAVISGTGSGLGIRVTVPQAL